MPCTTACSPFNSAATLQPNRNFLALAAQHPPSAKPQLLLFLLCAFIATIAALLPLHANASTVIFLTATVRILPSFQEL